MHQYHNHEYWMNYAITLADKAELRGEVPIGAVLILNNNIIGEGWNSSIEHHDPTAHAEIIALRQGGLYISNYRLLNTIMYVTLEPCIMCAGAMIHARINHLVFGTSASRTGVSSLLMNIFNHNSINHKITISSGVLKYNCSNKIRNFFIHRRNTIMKSSLL